jgi:uncharacterized repeat protein (TIGR01451 family)
MRARLIGFALVAAVAAVGSSSSATAAPAPAWSFGSIAVPTNFAPGSGGEDSYQVTATNIGGAATNGSPITLTDTLPAGLEVERVELELSSETGTADFGPTLCAVAESGGSTTVACAIPALVAGAADPTTVRPGESLVMVVYVKAGGEGPLLNQVTIEGGGIPPQAAIGRNEASSSPAPRGLQKFQAAAVADDGRDLTQAGGHPFEYVTTYAVNTEPGPPTGAPFLPSGGNVKDVEVALPAGLVGNPTAVPTCSHSEFLEQRVLQRPSGVGQNFRNGCRADSVVGFIAISQLEGLASRIVEPIYALQAPRGMPAQFGFDLVGLPFYIDTKVRTAGDYGITAYLSNLAEVKRASSATVVLWGIPAASAHDSLRGDCLNENPSGFEGISSGSCPASLTPRPFLTDPTNCVGPLSTVFAFDTWAAPGAFTDGEDVAPTGTGCGSVPFEATLTARPQKQGADSPTGLDVDLHLEQNESVAGVGAAHLRDAVVTLPAGLTVNPSSAAGLDACSPTQVGLTSAVGSGASSFDAAPAACPDASMLGTVEIDTPLLDHPINGSVYLAEQGQNPFGSLLALYIAADDERTGVVIKLAGHVEADPTSGQLTARFANNPQLPFEDLRVHFFEGPAAPLRTPTTCGIYTTTSDLRPWSAPESGPDATPSDSFTVSSAPGGGSCPRGELEQPNAPSFEAGTERPLAGAYSPLIFKLGREDGSQQVRRIDLTLPPGLLGKLAGVPYCPDAALAAAASATGRHEERGPSCPAASEVGQVTVTAGAGPRPLSVPGRAYLAGPYEGAPLSLAIVTPAVAGPFDLGTVVVRAAIAVDPLTTQITVHSDPIPTILQGIPLDLRTIALRLGRPGFILNPTSCEAKAIAGTMTSLAGATAALGDRFAVGGCRGLGFSPKLALRLTGGTTRGKDPALRAELSQPPGQANNGSIAVTLPPSLFIDQRHINNPCTRVQFAADTCPKNSILGTARAFTPLLDQPLEGPVFFRSNGGARKLPDLVLDLHGQIDIELIGYIDSVRKRGTEISRVRTTFAQVPDAPVSKFVLRLNGGKTGLLQNSRNLCRGSGAASIRLVGQSGRSLDVKAGLKVACHRGRRAKR